MRVKLKKKKSLLRKKIDDVKSTVGKMLVLSKNEETDIGKLFNKRNSFEQHLKKLLTVFSIKSEINNMEIKLMKQDVLKRILESVDKEVITKDSLFFRSKAYREFFECGKQVSSEDDDKEKGINIGVTVNNETNLNQYSVGELKERELTLVRQLKMIKDKKEIDA